MNKRNLILYLGGAVLGAVAGYAYYAIIGCNSGSCAITSNPVRSTIYGAIFGILIGIIVSPSGKKDQQS